MVTRGCGVVAHFIKEKIILNFFNIQVTVCPLLIKIWWMSWFLFLLNTALLRMKIDKTLIFTGLCGRPHLYIAQKYYSLPYSLERIQCCTLLLPSWVSVVRCFFRRGSTFIYSWSISHILEHDFFCLSHLSSSGQ